MRDTQWQRSGYHERQRNNKRPLPSKDTGYSSALHAGQEWLVGKRTYEGHTRCVTFGFDRLFSNRKGTPLSARRSHSEAAQGAVCDREQRRTGVYRGLFTPTARRCSALIGLPGLEQHQHACRSDTANSERLSPVDRARGANSDDRRLVYRLRPCALSECL